MNATRLFVLQSLARNGSQHGYEIARAAQVDHTDQWTAIKRGSLYGALHRMAAEGLVRVVRVERLGTSPERTVFAITEAGHQALVSQRDQALAQADLSPDPVDLALQYIPDLTPNELAAAVSRRLESLARQLASLEDARAEAAPHLVGLEPFTFEHSLMRLRTEVAWHARLLAHLEPAADSDPHAGLTVTENNTEGGEPR